MEPIFSAKTLAIFMWANMFILAWLLIARRVDVDLVSIMIFAAFFIVGAGASLSAASKVRK